MGMIAPATEIATDTTLDPIDELRAQYVACSYLATACQEALGRFPAPVSPANDPIAGRALEFLLAVEWDWRQTLQELSERVGRASSTVAGYNPEHAEDADTAREGVAHHRTDYRRRSSVRRRL
jgi:hypothetical protein